MSYSSWLVFELWYLWNISHCIITQLKIIYVALLKIIVPEINYFKIWQEILERRTPQNGYAMK